MMTEKTSKWECCCSPKFRLAFLSLFIWMCHAYGFNLGTDVTLDFHHELSSQDTSFFCLASLEGASEPFFLQNQINTRGLRPGQAGRIHTIVEQSQRNLTIHITIQDLQQIDEGLYIVDVAEIIDGTSIPHQYDTFVHVTYPPGQAECHIKNPPHQTGNWLVVSCSATLGSNNSGYPMCFQNSIPAPYLQLARHSDDYVTVDFWIDPMRQFQCCSSDALDIDPESCNDFVYTPRDESLTSYIPDNMAPQTRMPTSPSTEDGSPPHHGNTSQQNLIVIMAITFVVVVSILVAAVIILLRKKRFRGQRQQRQQEQSLPSYNQVPVNNC